MKFVGLAILIAYLLWHMSRSTTNRQLPDKIKMPEGLGGSSPLPPAGSDAPGLPPVRSAQTPPRETIDINALPVARPDLEPPPSSSLSWPLVGVGIGAIVLMAAWFALDWWRDVRQEQARQEAAAKQAEDRAAGLRILAANTLREQGFGGLQPGADCSAAWGKRALPDGSTGRALLVRVAGELLKDGRTSRVSVIFMDPEPEEESAADLPDPWGLWLSRIEIDGEVRWSLESNKEERGASEAPLPVETP